MLRGITKYLGRHHVALLALFLALGGTSAYAAASFINGKQIKPGSIPKNRLTKGAVKSLKGNKGAQGLPGQRGPTGAQGIQGIQGVQGPIGPSVTYQNHVAANLGISTNAAAPTTINTLTLPGPATYLVEASASMFDGASAPTNCGIYGTITRNGTQVGDHLELGTSQPTAGQYVESTLSLQRLLAVSGSSQTISLTAYRFIGSGTCTVFNRTLTAIQVGTGIGTLSATAAAPARATGVPGK